MGKNSYKQLGPFVYGDPRFLAGGSAARTISYNDSAVATNDGEVICPPDTPAGTLYGAMASNGQHIASNKCGYHGNRANNVFVSKADLQFPTVGIELETILNRYDSDIAQAFSRQLYSNWFHAENDGSLDREHCGTYGYEIVTTVLPARLYRDPEVWAGFQNLISPFVHSFSTSETGLHVHVGMSYFNNTKFPACPTGILPAFGKLLTSRLYYSLIPRSFAQRVFLRPGSMGYCQETRDYRLTRPLTYGTGRKIIDEVLFPLLAEDFMIEETWVQFGLNAIRARKNHANENNVLKANWPTDRCYNMSDRLRSGCGLSYGHNSELNASPRLTLEFRRGKGTTNALSIHRMIELCCLTVMYAGYVIDNPDDEVSTKAFMGYLIENTKSRALKTLAEKEIAKCS